VKGLNTAEEKMAAIVEGGDSGAIRAVCDALAFNGSGHILHTIYWTCMSPDGGGNPAGDLAEQINSDFGSVDALKKTILAASGAVQGSGWGVLAWQPMWDQLVILQAEKHQNLTQWGAAPLLVIDMWEHAFYLDYENRKQEYLDGFFDVVNWDSVAERFSAARS
jgi:Fe-Mn family superoxide dismutase